MKTVAVLLVLTFALCGRAFAQLQYTAELLPPPADVPGYATEAYALNNRGQVFGRAVSIAARGPVLWTDGIPAWLPVPNGHYWYDYVGVHFINSSGDVVSVVQDARATGNEGVRPILWVDGAATQVPLPVPRCDGYLERPVDSESEWGLSSWPVGFNKAGHILLSACNNFWIWDGSSFELLAQPSPVPGCLFLQNAIAFGSNHLNDADHASLDRTWFIDWGCPLPARQPGVFISPTDFVSLPEEAGFAADINNRDQVVIWFRDSSGIVNLRLWNGRQMVELGQGGYQSLNNLGEVAFMTGSPLRPHLFRDGVVRPVALPAEVANLRGFLLLNDGGQIAGWDPVSGRAVILTPVPTIKSFAIPAALTACKSGTATMTLEYRAAGNLLVSLSSSAPGVSLPASVLFKAGVSKKSFAIRTTPVASLQDVTITATLGDERLDRTLTLRPIGVASLALSPNPVSGGNTVTGTVTLECVAGPGDVTVALSSSAPAVATPAAGSLTIPQGVKSGTFTVYTSPVTAVKKPTIRAAVTDAQSKAKTLTVTP